MAIYFYFIGIWIPKMNFLIFYEKQLCIHVVYIKSQIKEI